MCTRLKVKKVINFSPGSGMLERVCLQMGIPCVAVCRNASHANWLSNVLDRTAMHTIVSKGTALYDGEAKSSVDRHFKEILERIQAQDDDETVMPTEGEIEDEAE